jgi:LmbE family N-acetylglucosaminyl deacetylase
MNLNKAYNFKEIAVIVAHPDDETLWAGGMILMNPGCKWTIISLCRANDTDRAPKFFSALKVYGASGAMGDLDDGPGQKPLLNEDIEKSIASLLPRINYDLIVTHSPAGEYTRHKRHEETGRAVFYLWEKGKITSSQLWFFAYEDDNKTHYSEAIKNADIVIELSENIWLKKYSMITKTYQFLPDGFEALTTPKTEAFWCLKPKTSNKES